MIIVEGANGTGKSTLSKILMKELGLRYHKEQLTRESVKKLTFEKYVHDANLLDQDLLLDRFHLGQYVYPKVYKDGREPLSAVEQQTVERILMNRGAILIYCDASYDFIKRTYDTRGETMQTLKEVDKECKYFNETYSRSIMTKFYFCPEWSKKKQEEIIQNIIEIYKIHQLYAEKLKQFKGCGDIFNAPVALIGEQFNCKGPYHKHAFGWHSGSSKFLHQTLAFTSNPKHYYLTNAIKTNDENKNVELLIKELSIIQPKIIIALGRKASYILKLADISHEYVPHPQFIKRFKYSQIEIYAEIIDRLSKLKEDEC